MGTWGAGIFDNDTASDLLADVAEVGVAALQETVADCVDAWADDDFSDVEMDMAAASAAVIATAHGRPVSGDAEIRAALSSDTLAEIRQTVPLAEGLKIAQMVAALLRTGILQSLEATPEHEADYMENIARLIMQLEAGQGGAVA